jgi:hypothetical protein
MNYRDEYTLPDRDFSLLKGKTIVEFYDLEKGSEDVTIKCSDGTKYVMYYSHDCCATCDIEDIIGDPNDLLNSELLLAEEVISHENPKDQEYPDDSFTWTFYKLSTIKGSVTLRWYGSSNGYYSESVTFKQLENWK